MNGGLTTWNYAGYDLETQANEPQKETDFGISAPANPDLIDTIDEVKQLLTQDNFTLVDNRTWGRIYRRKHRLQLSQHCWTY